ncbi:MAG: hypothetical protein ABJF10_19305 [Chthoniobacter sp.]|uniref:hypothetical protein n=1 Tax=Chthoniobacter sp. TaxID=2510640 RepID=UPI0032A8DC94
MICLAAFTACQSNDVPSGSHYVVSAKTAFYKFGPAQSFGPDFVLNEGAKVTILEHAFGFSRVMTEDGTAGFVSTDDLKPAPVSYSTSTKTKTNYTIQLNRPMFDQSPAVEKHSNVPPTHGTGSPLFDTSDTPLPSNAATPKPKPGFHF